MPKVETVKVKSDAHPSGYMVVNKEDAPKQEPKQEAQKSRKPRGQ